MRSYLEFSKACENVIIIRYEDLVANPQGFLSSLSKHRIKIQESFVNLESSTKGDAMSFNYYAKLAKTFNPHEYYSASDLAYVTSMLDESICQIFYPDVPQGIKGPVINDNHSRM